ncbi:MAG: sugar O-acetyltransferase [Cyanobacteria bacterium SZAS LIN-3]|nr:sugar O-acetyltransferase [Cyanobacteria bacterium SZAS LIN-3]
MPIRTEKEKMLAGELYRATEPSLVSEYAGCQRFLQRYNATGIDDRGKRTLLLGDLFGAVGENPCVMPIFMCDYGSNIYAGRNLFVNYNCVFLDCNRIDIGNDVQIGPAVQIYTASHPLDPQERLRGLESAHPVKIGNNVWIGGGAIILPGVTIGDNAVVGAGSVVTRDVAAGAVVAGNPAREIRSSKSTV